MNKKILITVGVVIVLGIAWWLVSPLWKDVALNEDLPTNTQVQDNLATMDEETKKEMEEQTNAVKDNKMGKADAMPSDEPATLNRATMVASAHDVEGEALFVQSGTETFLRFENLKTINGPDLRIYLSTDLSNDDIVDLGELRATEGNVNYTIPAGTDLKKYDVAMIWCRAFGVLFSYAEL